MADQPGSPKPSDPLEEFDAEGSTMTWTRTSHNVLKAGILLLGIGVIAGVWQILATQLPNSPLHAGVLPGPVDKLRAWCFTGSVIIIVLALCRAGTGVSRERPRAVRWLFGGGITVLLSLLYGAATGMPGEQLLDPRWDAQVMIALRMLGLLAALIPASLLASDAWHPPQPSPEAP